MPIIWSCNLNYCSTETISQLVSLICCSSYFSANVFCLQLFRHDYLLFLYDRKLYHEWYLDKTILQCQLALSHLAIVTLFWHFYRLYNCLRKWSLVSALILPPQLDEQSGSVICDRPILSLCHMGNHPTFTSCMWLWDMMAVRETRDRRPWMMMLERRCWVHDLVSLKWYCNLILISILLCVSSRPYHPRNKGLPGRGTDITSGPFHIPPLTTLSDEFLLLSGEDGGECGSWCLSWQHHTETPWVISTASLHTRRRKKRLDIFNLHRPSGYLDCKLLRWTAEYAGEVNITIMFFLIRQR